MKIQNFGSFGFWNRPVPLVPHAAIATVEMENGANRRMLHCKRLDCDNWQTEETDETPKSIYDGS